MKITLKSNKIHAYFSKSVEKNIYMNVFWKIYCLSIVIVIWMKLRWFSGHDFETAYFLI
jgi:hypothetical protein